MVAVIRHRTSVVFGRLEWPLRVRLGWTFKDANGRQWTRLPNARIVRGYRPQWGYEGATLLYPGEGAD